MVDVQCLSSEFQMPFWPSLDIRDGDIIEVDCIFSE